MATKLCPKCGEHKEYCLFYKNKHSKINCSPYCKVCSNQRTTSYARDNKDKINPKLFGYSIKRRYNLSVEEFESLLISQKYMCAICETTRCSSGRNFAVDHCHTTGKIRGLLCSSCNTGLGQFKDNKLLLQKAINYLD